MFFVKRILPFILALILGYTVGYEDAYRGPSSLGWKVAALIDGMRPESVRGARAKNAEAIRAQQRQALPTLPE